MSQDKKDITELTDSELREKLNNSAEVNTKLKAEKVELKEKYNNALTKLQAYEKAEQEAQEAQKKAEQEAIFEAEVEKRVKAELEKNNTLNNVEIDESQNQDNQEIEEVNRDESDSQKTEAIRKAASELKW